MPGASQNHRFLFLPPQVQVPHAAPKGLSSPPGVCPWGSPLHSSLHAAPSSVGLLFKRLIRASSHSPSLTPFYGCSLWPFRQRWSCQTWGPATLRSASQWSVTVPAFCTPCIPANMCALDTPQHPVTPCPCMARPTTSHPNRTLPFSL